MKIRIYRGTHQIGGCATEISTEKHRIVIDFGANLPDNCYNIIIMEGKR